jgi:hypothetical protein
MGTTKKQNKDRQNKEMCALRKIHKRGYAPWLKPILPTQEVDIRSIIVQGQPGQKVRETPISTNGWE